MYQQVLLLLAIVLIKQFSDRDASQGLDHTLVDMSVFIVVVGCCWATTWFLTKFFLPVPAADSQFEPEFLILNSVVCWPQPDPFANGEPASRPSEASLQISMHAGQWMQRASWVGAVGLVMFGFLSTHRLVYGGFVNASRLPRVHAQQLANTEWKELFPEVFDRWRRMEVTHQIQPIDGSDRATINWHFAWQGQVVQLSVTLPFKRHPRLASKYEALGWRVLMEQAKLFVPAGSTVPTAPNSAKSTVGDEQHPTLDSNSWTELRIANELGGQALALVAYHPLQEQSEPVLEYQVVLFCESGEQLTVQQLSELYNGFHLANEHLRKEIEPRLLELLGAAQ